VSAKGWTEATLGLLGVERDDEDRWVIPTATGLLRYADDGRKPKMLARAGATRELWPAPEDQPGEALAVVEGEPDAISFVELSDDLMPVPVVAVPGTGKFDDRWPARIAAGRQCVYLFCDADTVGRARMRRLAEQVTALGVVVYVIDLAPERDDGYDVGDLLVEVGPERAAETVVRLMREAEPYTPLESAEWSGPVRNKNGPDHPRFFTRPLKLSELVPVKFAWSDRLVRGVLNVPYGEEGIGKGTILAWIIAALTRGELAGDLRGRPARVLWVGDEDGWTDTVGPRLYAAKADLARVEMLDARDEYDVLNVHADAAELEHVVKAGPFEIVVFEALLDHMPATRQEFGPQYVRTSLRPLRRMLRATGATGLGTMHAKKGRAATGREKLAGSHQYNAVSRSTLLVDRHPDDAGRRVLVGHKQNNSREPVPLGFTIKQRVFLLNGQWFHVPVARDVQDEPHVSLNNLFTARERKRDANRAAVLDALTAEPQSERALVRATGVPKTTVHRILAELAECDEAEQTKAGWRVVRSGPSIDRTGPPPQLTLVDGPDGAPHDPG
jgi:hypothetical protein